MTRKEMTDNLIKLGDLVDNYDSLVVNQDMNDPEYTKKYKAAIKDSILLQCKLMRKDKKFGSLHKYERQYIVMIEKEFL